MRDQITEEQAKTILDEITQPLFATDEGQHFLKGQERLNRIRVQLFSSLQPTLRFFSLFCKLVYTLLIYLVFNLVHPLRTQKAS